MGAVPNRPAMGDTRGVPGFTWRLLARGLPLGLLLAGACSRHNPAFGKGEDDGAAGSGGNGGGGAGGGDGDGGGGGVDAGGGDRGKELPPGACVTDNECGAKFCNFGACEAEPRFGAPARIPLAKGLDELCPGGPEPAFAITNAKGDELAFVCKGSEWDLFLTRTDGSGAFAAPLVPGGINVENDYILPSHFSLDGTTLYFSRVNPGNGADLYSAHRGGPGGLAFSEVAPLDGLNSDNDDNALWMRDDGRLAIFSSRRAGSDRACGKVDTDLYVASRSDTNRPFQDIKTLSPPSAGQWDTKPTLPAHERFMIFYRGDTDCDTDNRNLYLALRDGDVWAEPRPITEVNSAKSDLWPSVTADGRTLYFTSQREGFWFIYVARR